MTQTQIKKPAAKPAETKKTQPKAASLVIKVAKPGQKLYAVSDAKRPGKGSALFAHTHAVFIVTGALAPSRPAVPRSTLTTLMGPRAIAYHTKQGNLEASGDDKIRLSLSGSEKFRERAVDANLTNGFVDMFLTGNPGKTGIVKSSLFETQF